jgi:hypothetical protein
LPPMSPARMVVGVGPVGLRARRAHAGAAVPAGRVNDSVGQGFGAAGAQDLPGGGIEGVQVPGQSDRALTAPDRGHVIKPPAVARAGRAADRSGDCTGDVWEPALRHGGRQAQLTELTTGKVRP